MFLLKLFKIMLTVYISCVLSIFWYDTERAVFPWKQISILLMVIRDQVFRCLFKQVLCFVCVRVPGNCVISYPFA